MKNVKPAKLDLPAGLLKELEERRKSTVPKFTPEVDAMVKAAREGNPPIPFKQLPEIAEQWFGLKYTASQLSNRYHRYLVRA